MAKIISGKELSAKLKLEMADEVKTFPAKYGRVPHLVVILVGEDPGSVSYVTGKAKASAEVGIRNTTIRKPESVSEAELLDIITALNLDDEVDGILVQLPLPKHIDEDKVIAAIDKQKDVDGFHPLNVAALWQKQPCTLPCTPKGILKMLRAAGVEIAGKRAVVIGRSNIVGLPVSKLLLDANATVTMAHSRTRNLAEVTRGAEILVVAIGRPKFVTAEMVSPGAVVIDVGVNRDPMGTGLGAELICNTDVFCFASPFHDEALPPRLLHPRRVFEGVREGVEHGGNKSGIPTVNGYLVFDERYLGKPLVY